MHNGGGGAGGGRRGILFLTFSYYTLNMIGVIHEIDIFLKDYKFNSTLFVCAVMVIITCLIAY
jgi:hypothetical protein